ncbi:MAG TPA: phosphoglycerate dehydrogenase [Bdellovibrionota bacterium]|nr:phosphoglycerate dehydrogenase [Bdellovibrionota bacterium]
MKKALVSCPYAWESLSQEKERFEKAGIALIRPEAVTQQLTEDELLRYAPEIAGILCGDDPVNDRVIQSAPKLRVIVKWGVGTDNIDIEAAKKRRIQVTNTPGLFSDDVADVTIAYIVLLFRRLHQIDARVRSGDWHKPIGRSLQGRVLGILGLGNIGRAVAQRAVAMKMVPIGYDPDSKAQEIAKTLGVEIVDPDVLLQKAEILTLHCSLTKQTRHFIDARSLARCRKGAFLVNTSRGGLIEEKALIQALGDGTLAAAALDVFEAEPLAASNALCAHSNVILGSHNASHTLEAIQAVNKAAYELLLNGLSHAA